MSPVIWRPRALRDLERLFRFLKDKNPEPARKAALRIAAAADDLSQNPRLGKPMPDETGRRELSTAFGRRGYVIRYMLDDDDTVVIIRVWHTLEDRDF